MSGASDQERVVGEPLHRFGSLKPEGMFLRAESDSVKKHKPNR